MKKRRISIFLVAIFMFLSICVMPLSIQAKEIVEDENVVRVAYLLSPGYQEGGEDEYKSGQGYEYLQKIASYTGWTYEYVYGDFAELLQMLVDGDVDIMGNLSYTQERAQLFYYGKYEQGRESFYVYVNENNTEIRADDFSTLNGKRIGVNKDSYQETVWKKWCEDNQVECETVEFSNKEERENSLNDGTTDASLGSLMANRNENTMNWRSVFSFGDAPYYFVINKNKPELLEQLNKAQGKILNDDPYYNEELIKRYLPNGIISQSQLDIDEKKWIENHRNPVKIGCLDDFLPISDMDEDGNIRGVLIDVIDEILHNFQNYDIQYEVSAYADYEQMISDLKAGVIDIAAPIYGDYWCADREGVILTSPFMTTTMLYLQYGYPKNKDNIKMGIDKQNPIQLEYAKIHYSDCELEYYSSMDEVAKAIKKGKVDAGLSTACNYHVNAILYSDIGDLNRSTLPYDIDIAMAVAKSNPDLMSIINRGIYSIGDTVVYNSMAQNSNVDKKITLEDYISENPIVALMVVCTIVVLAFVIILALVIIVIRLKNANKRASTDAMTGLLNKISMSDRVKENLEHGGVFFMLDIDNFKVINDVLGHENGDKVIVYLAEILQDIFRSEDLIGRFGGDEFMVFLPGKLGTEEFVQKKVEQIQNQMLACEVINEHKDQVKGTVSIGVICVKPDNNYTYIDVFRKADAALYKAKARGKNTYVMERY